MTKFIKIKLFTFRFLSFPRFYWGLCMLLSFVFFSPLLWRGAGGEVFAQFYNGLQMTFGKNRVQYIDEFLWSFYKFEKFDTYFYLGGKELAIYTSKMAEQYIEELETILDYKLQTRLQFIIYNKLSDLKQSNIGLITYEDYNTGGITHIEGNKIFIYYEGEWVKLNRLIKAGIAEVMLRQMIYGESVAENIKNTYLIAFPEWYLKGLISYLSDEWNIEIENRVMDGILSGKYEKFNRLTGIDAIYAGHSIWKYIADKYGKNVIPNILYMARVSRSVENGFLFILGTTIKTLSKEWIDYYDKQYYELSKQRYLPKKESLIKRPKKTRVYSQLKISPDGNSCAFVSNQIGKYIVWLYSFNEKKRRKIMKGGYKLDEKTDYSYPLLGWHPSSKILTILREHKGKIWLNYYYPEEKKKEKKELFHFEKVLDFTYSKTGLQLALSAVQNGQSDIYIYNFTGHTHQRITNDFYDDLNPCFIRNDKQIIFASNRPTDTLLPKGNNPDILSTNVNVSDNYDLFIYTLNGDSSEHQLLQRVTNTPLYNEIAPIEGDEKRILYLCDENDVQNRFIAELDSVISHIDTAIHYRYLIETFPVSDYARNILEHNISPTNAGTKKYGEIVFFNGKYRMYIRNFKDLTELKPVLLQNSVYRKSLISKKEKTLKDTVEQIEPAIKSAPPAKKRLLFVLEDEPSEYDTIPLSRQDTLISFENYVFDIEKQSRPIDTSLKEKKIKPTDIAETKEKNIDTPAEFILPKQRNYNVTFYLTTIATQVDNNYLNPTYQLFTGGGGFFNPDLFGTVKLGIIDLFEDFKITGGVRPSANLANNEYFIRFEDLQKRLDKTLTLYRQSLTGKTYTSTIKVHTHELNYTLKWPFDNVISFQTTLIYKNERAVYLSTDWENLQRKNEYRNWAGLKSQFVFDNTRQDGLNIYYGTRYKIFGEWLRQIDEKETNFFVVGLDYRHYQKIHRQFIWANRLAASTSFGQQKLIYYLGGVDNWINLSKKVQKFNENIPIDTTQNYVYQTLATNMRGFTQNIRNGNNFILINSELRLPLFRYLLNRPIKNDFLANFQLIGFADIGTAWSRKFPFSEEKTYYTEEIEQYPIKVSIIHEMSPYVVGYGFGLRARLGGYFFRLDRAWGWADREFNQPIWYLSLSLDF